MRLDNTQLAISKTVESSFNTPETTAGNFEWFPTTDPLFILPKAETINDGNRVGRNAASHLCNTYWSPTQISVADDVETGVPARLARRLLGGLATSTPVAAGVYDHTFAILPPQVGDVLPSFSMLSVLGAADFLLAGLMVNKMKWSQKNGDRVQHETEIVGSGKFTNPSAVSPFPSLGALPCMDGHKTIVKYTETDGTTVVNLSTLGKVIEWMIEHDNKIRTNRRRSGDPVITVGGVSAAYVRKMPRGKYTTTGQLVVDFADLSDWQKSVKNEILNNLTITVPGQLIANVAGTDYFNEYEIIIPKFGFEGVDTGEDEGDAATPITIVPFEDPVTKGTMKMRVRNGSATLV
jgi:hypothetical protein